MHISMAALELPIPRKKLCLVDQKDYKLKMKNIIRVNANLDQFTDLEIYNSTLELAGDQVPISRAIRKMKNLTTLRLENIVLHSSTFLEVESKELKLLHLRWCKTQLSIASLFKNDLCYKDSLVELRLEINQWTEISNSVFEFCNLHKLLLYNNSITHLPDKFMNLPKLQELDLRSNQLRQLPPSIFVLPNLSKLDLSGNLINELPNMLVNLPKLEYLSLARNQLRHVPSSIFALQNLSTLELSSNYLSELPDMFMNLPKLKTIDLDNNQLASFPPTLFECRNLSELSLNNSRITELPDIIKLPKLESLLLCDNQLRYVPSSIFESQNLSKLELRQNYITELPDKFTNLHKLKYLSLSRNRLQYLPPSIFALHLKKLDIANNEFNFEIPPSFGSDIVLHSLKELSYRAIFKHKLKVKEGMLPEKFLKDLANFCQCICGCKFVKGQDLLFFCNLKVISRVISYNRDEYYLKFPIRGKMCTSLKSCFPARFTKCI